MIIGKITDYNLKVVIKNNYLEVKIPNIKEEGNEI